MGLLVASSGCGKTRHESLEGQVSLRYLPGCAPEVLDQLTVEALGDFPARDDTIVSFDARTGIGTLTSLPLDTRLFRIQVSTPSYRGAALAQADAQGSALSRFEPVLVLPSGVVCQVPHVAPPALQGTALTVSGRSVLIAGGVEAGLAAANQLVRLSVEDQIAERLPKGLFVPRAGACAVSLRGPAEEAWIIGGAPSLSPDTAALSSLERFDPAREEVVGLGRLARPRVNARALTLPDGSVLLAGGESSVGAGGLRTLERIDPEQAEGTELAAELPWAGSLEALLLRDDGVVVLAGRSAMEPQLALFDPKSEQIVPIASPQVPWDPALALVLPGARIALFEIARDPTSGTVETTGALWLLLPDGTQVRVSQWFSSFSGLTDARAVTLDDGRILLTGSSAGVLRARVLDPGRGDVRVRPLAALPIALFTRSDGSALALSADAVQVLRENARTPYDNPGGTLLADDTAESSALTFDAPGRFMREGVGLVAVAALARFDVTQLRYEDVRIVARVEGPGELLLRRADGGELAIEIGGARVGPPFCTLSAIPGEPVHLERRGESVLITSAREARRCHLDGLTGPIALAMQARESGVTFASLEVTRF